MNFIKNALIIAFALFFPILASAETAEEKGLTISLEAEKRAKGFQDYTSNMLMTLRDKHGRESIRNIRSRTLEVIGDGDKSITIFDNPRDVKGSAFLNVTHKEGDDDQWLFLPALKRVKRISSRNKSGSFMGSEFSYEDISSMEVEKFAYKWIKDEEYNGMECFVVERYPIDKKNSGYTKQIVWLDKAEYREQKTEFYDRKNMHLKTLTTSGYKKYIDRFWQPETLNMVNHQTGKSTEIILTEYKFHTGLSSKDFTKNSLKRIR